MVKSKKESASEKEKIDVQAETLVGDMRDGILDVFKQHADWKNIKEAQQRDIIAAAQHLANEVVRRTAAIIAGRGFKSMQCTLTTLTVKDGLKMVLTASKQSEGRHDLVEHQGGSVTVVLTDINPYLGQRSAPEIDHDEPRMFDRETGEVDD